VTGQRSAASGRPYLCVLQEQIEKVAYWLRAEVLLSCKTGCGLDFGDLGVLERDDLPLAIFLYDDQRWASFYFAPFVAFLELQVCSGEYDGDIGPQKANAPQREGGMAASVDRLEDVPVRPLYGPPPVPDEEPCGNATYERHRCCQRRRLLPGSGGPAFLSRSLAAGSQSGFRPARKRLTRLATNRYHTSRARQGAPTARVPCRPRRTHRESARAPGRTLEKRCSIWYAVM